MRDGEMQTTRAVICWFVHQLPASTGAGPALELKAGNLAQASHLDARNLIMRDIMAASQGLLQRKRGRKQSSTSAWDGSILVACLCTCPTIAVSSERLVLLLRPSAKEHRALLVGKCSCLISACLLLSAKHDC